MDDLIERLLETSPRYSQLTGEHVHDVFCNRDGKEAADRITSLQQESERLREALEEIRDLPGEINPSNYDHDDACELNRQFCYSHSIAVAALRGEG